MKQQKLADGTTTQYAGNYIYENGSLKFCISPGRQINRITKHPSVYSVLPGLPHRGNEWYEIPVL